MSHEPAAVDVGGLDARLARLAISTRPTRPDRQEPPWNTPPDYDDRPTAPPPRDEFLVASAVWQRWLDVDDDATIARLKMVVDRAGEADRP